jgi:hypothetical protein
VHFLLSECAAKFFFRDRSSISNRVANHPPLSSLASLDRRSVERRIRSAPQQKNIVIANVHRFEESIGGRPYLIEVAAVSKDRWRACIVRIPGVPTALMPFYGSTPDEAARQLSEWLTRAHRRNSSGTAPV